MRELFWCVAFYCGLVLALRMAFVVVMKSIDFILDPDVTFHVPRLPRRRKKAKVRSSAKVIQFPIKKVG